MNITEIITLAKNNDVFAQNDLGVAYMTGDDVEQDEHQAVYWFQRSASQGNPEAMANLGMCLLLGKGLQKNISASLYILESAYLLGVFNSLSNVLDAIQSKDIDIEDIIALSNEKNIQATVILGLCYDHGISINTDHQKAMELFENSARNNNPVALWILAHFIADQDEPDLPMAKLFLDKVEDIASKQVGRLANDQIKKDIFKVNERLHRECGFILMKVIPECNQAGHPKDQYVKDLLSGKLFMKSLDQFGDLLKRDSSSNNAFRGDVLEGYSENFGLGYNPHLYKTNIDGSIIKDGMLGSIDILTLRKKVFCITAIDYYKPSKTFIAPSLRMKEFGKYAVIIYNVEEFLKRVHKAFERYQKENNAEYGLAYNRVSYDVDLKEKRTFDEFHKSTSYSWQNEFRISLDFSQGKFSQSMLDKVTDSAKSTFPGSIELDEDILSLADWIYFDIGDISDICQCMEIDELFNDTHSLKLENEPVVIQSYETKREARPTFCKAVTAMAFPNGECHLAVSKEAFFCAVL